MKKGKTMQIVTVSVYIPDEQATKFSQKLAVGKKIMESIEENGWQARIERWDHAKVLGGAANEDN